MDGRIKVQRLDRNGKLVSRWVKPELPLKKSPLLAAPVSPVQAGTVARVHAVRETLEDIMLLRFDGIDKSIRDLVPEDRLGKLHDMLAYGRHRFTLAQHLIKALQNPREGESLVPRLINHLDNLPDDVRTDDAVYILSGLAGYDRQFSVEQERALIEPTYAAIRTGLGVIITSGRSPLSGYMLESTELAELVVNRPEDSAAIAEIMRTHLTDEAWKINQLLDGELPSSIASGAL